jgi:hypothetical protein
MNPSVGAASAKRRTASLMAPNHKQPHGLPMTLGKMRELELRNQVPAC